MSLAGQKYTLLETISVMIYDKLAWLQWAKTKDGAKGQNMPQPLAKKLFEGENQDDNDVEGFTSGKEFEEARKRIIEGGE